MDSAQSLYNTIIRYTLTKRYTLKYAHVKKTIGNDLKRAHGRCT